MKNVVITGSARGLGLEMAKEFRRNNNHVLISDINEENLEKAVKILKDIPSKGSVYYCVADVTKTTQIKKLVSSAVTQMGEINQTKRYGNFQKKR